MTASSTSSWPFRPPSYRRGGTTDRDLRVSDADRGEITDLLSKHYGDGRLSDTEFQERVDRAMQAKTRGDLDGLLDDLPPLDAPAVPKRPRRRHRLLPLLLWVLVAVVTVSVARALVFWHLPWLLIGLVAFLLWRRAGRRHRCYDAGRLPLDRR